MIDQNCEQFTHPGIDLFRNVRAAFICDGTSLNAWCLKHGVTPSNARHCLTGSWDGPKGKKLRAKILRAAGLTTKGAV